MYIPIYVYLFISGNCGGGGGGTSVVAPTLPTKSQHTTNITHKNNQNKQTNKPRLRMQASTQEDPPQDITPN